MCEFPNGYQVLFPLLLSVCATSCLGYAVIECNFVEITHSDFTMDVRGVSVGFWQTMDELNGNFNEEDRFACVPWTNVQKESFDALWNFGRYGGAVAFGISLLVTFILFLTMFTMLPRFIEKFLGYMQLLLVVLSSLLLSTLGSKMCREFDCWLDIGGVLTVAASVIFLFCWWISKAIGFSGKEDDNRKLVLDPTEIWDGGP